MKSKYYCSELLRGGSGPKFLKTSSELMVDPKGPPSEPTFWLGLEAPDPLAPQLRPCPFPPKIGFFPKSIKITIYRYQSIDNSLLSYQNKFQPDWTKNGRVMAKKHMPIYIWNN